MSILRLTHVVVHHSLTKDSETVSWNAIRQYHTARPPVGLGWKDIGYHFGVERIGPRVEALRGRPLTMEGAHTKEAGMNRAGIGVCVVGNFDAVAPEEDVWGTTVSLVRDLCEAFTIPVGHVIGHREAGLMAGFDWRKGQFKTCPGRMFDMDAFRQAVELAIRTAA